MTASDLPKGMTTSTSISSFVIKDDSNTDTNSSNDKRLASVDEDDEYGYFEGDDVDVEVDVEVDVDDVVKEEEEEDSNSIMGPGSSVNTTGTCPHADGASSSTSNHTHEQHHKCQDNNNANEVIAREENRNVVCLRMLVIMVLVFSTVGVAAAVYVFVSQAEYNTFEQAFEDDADKVLEAIGNALDNTLASVDAFLVSLVSFAAYTNSSWPFVTLPDYAMRVAKLRSLSKAVLVTQYHYVESDQRKKWEAYAKSHDSWVQEGIDFQKTDENFHGEIVTDYWTRDEIHGNSPDPYTSPGPYLPKWQQGPVIPIYAPYNWDAMVHPSLSQSLDIVQGHHKIAISDVSNLPNPDNGEYAEVVDMNNQFIKDFVGDDEDATEPFSDIYVPMLDFLSEYMKHDDDDEYNTNNSTSSSSSGSINHQGKFVGVFAMTFYWRDLIKDILPAEEKGIITVFENSCGQTFTYQIDGPRVTYVGHGDLHETRYDYISKTSPLIDLGSIKRSNDRSYTGLPLSGDGCTYVIYVYPSEEMKNNYTSNDPVIFTVTAIIIFLFTSLVFISYDYMVERRQRKLMKTAIRTNAIVTSLFPSTVRDRLFGEDQKREQSKRGYEHNKMRLKTFLNDGTDSNALSSANEIMVGSDRPIADLFPHCTVLFSDISGFTAWSSVREPSQVFTLLETLYSTFDSIALKRDVFKVETIGDAYVAVTGLPEPREDHAIVMVKFARDCLLKTVDVVRELEKSLGPGTADLRLRFGLHSGEVTAGVLRGQKSRFQLFGDTVNTAARMEGTGVAHKIQISNTTAELLIMAGKGSWLKPREDLVEAKGKGKMQTYWVQPSLMGHVNTAPHRQSSAGEDSQSTSNASESLDDRTKRLVDWNTDILSGLLKLIVSARRASSNNEGNTNGKSMRRVMSLEDFQRRTILEEAQELIELPEYNTSAYELMQKQALDKVTLGKTVVSQLRDYVVAIAGYYRSNPFHNFDHASHVGMSVAKLLTRIITAEEVLAAGDVRNHDKDVGLSLHDFTFGISSDPLTQFACVFSALIHDVDHPGVPNNRLVEENVKLATKFKGKSVAEQNSVDLAWSLFMGEEFTELRKTICPTEDELKRFRQLVVNIVMATDIMDKDLKKLRNDRWDKAFSPLLFGESKKVQHDRKATIVVEHLIQASDVAHTMQHWHIYIKWNEKLFDEMYQAYKAGRSEKDPSEFWYEGELSFFDFYIIPLAKKLRDCGVFGVSSDEYLSYAQKNREEWELRGREVVARYIERYKNANHEE